MDVEPIKYPAEPRGDTRAHGVRGNRLRGVVWVQWRGWRRCRHGKAKEFGNQLCLIQVRNVLGGCYG